MTLLIDRAGGPVLGRMVASSLRVGMRALRRVALVCGRAAPWAGELDDRMLRDIGLRREEIAPGPLDRRL